MQTPFAVRKISADDKAGSRVHRSVMFISLEYKGTYSTPIFYL